MPTLADLLAPRTTDQILTDLIARIEAARADLQAAGVDVTDLTSGAVARTLLEIEAASQADLYNLAVIIAQSGFLASASDDYLDILALSAYNLTRNPSVFAQINLTLSCAAGFGPYSLQPGDVIAATTAGLIYQSTTGGTLPAGGSLVVTAIAQQPGSAYNVATGTITQLKTPLPGVSVTNALGSISVAGADAETDDALRLRCRLRWPALGQGAPADAYSAWAREASPNITRVRVLDPSQTGRGQGTVDVIVYGQGGIGSADVTAANTLIQSRRPLVADVLVQAATPAVITVTATIKVKTAYLAAVQAQVALNLQALQTRIDIGGTVYRSALIEALFEPLGSANATVDVSISAPAANVAFGTREAVELVLNPTWVTV